MDFYTQSGLEITGVTAQQMRTVDTIAIEETGPNLFQMMENAGRNLAQLTLEYLGKGWQKAQVLVLAGSGGNGGGGICAGRHLANRGVKCTLCLARPERLAEATALQRHLFSAAGGVETTFGGLYDAEYDVIVDALVGYGLHSQPEGMLKDLIQWANEEETDVISLDVPSGVDASSGATPGVFVTPVETLTLALPKSGLLPQRTGELFLGDLGIPAVTFEKAGIAYQSPFGKDFVIRIDAMREKT